MSKNKPILTKHDMWIALSNERWGRLYLPSDLNRKEARQLCRVLNVVAKANKEAGIEFKGQCCNKGG